VRKFPDILCVVLRQHNVGLYGKDYVLGFMEVYVGCREVRDKERHFTVRPMFFDFVRY
jgi:hypothetical protein